MIKLNKTQQLILDSHSDGLVVIPSTKRLLTKQAAKLVDIGILTRVDSESYRVETFDPCEIYELLVMYRAKCTGKLARQVNGRYHLYRGATHYVVQYDYSTRLWVSVSIGFETEGFKTRKQAIEAIN